MNEHNLIDNRQIRVFISSTFQDMQDERDYLMKRTFPKLRKLAAERDVILTELDLRWGITEEESKSGKVVEICLREIENSIPFFIGIIGNRYGWVPKREELGGNVTKRFEDVDRYIEQHLSVTEMEMQYGVLSREEDMHAYFYIKDQEEGADNPEMLNHLKEEVKRSKYPSSTYASPADLAEQVEDAFVRLLDSLFPDGNISDQEKEHIGQRSFLNQLCQTYIRDEKNFYALDAWLENTASRQYVVTGASGLGKSALVANWLKEKLADEGCKYSIIYHFTGNGGSQSTSEHIAKSIANEINALYGWDDADGKLNDIFLRVSSQGSKPLLIVIDAINQIVDIDDAKLLNWLPTPSKNIKILFSTLEDDRTMEVFKERHYPIYTLQPLDIERRRQLVKSYLKLYAKSLKEEQAERIVTDTQCENTLVLKTLLDELINFGIYEKLDEKIEYYLHSESIGDFYQNLLISYENEYKEYGEKFVEEILSLIAVSKSGLTEDEILSITEIKKALHWSSFYCAFNKMFCVKNGRISFSHTYIREAIEKRYGLNDADSDYRYDIIVYYAPLLKENKWNALSEIAYQLYKLETPESAQQLYDFLKYPATTSVFYRIEETLCRNYWIYLNKHGYTFDCFVDYKDNLYNGDDYIESQRFVFHLRRLLHTFGEYRISMLLEDEFLKRLEASHGISDEALVKAYNDLAFEYTTAANETSNQKDFDTYVESAFELYNKSINLAKKCSQAELAVAYNGYAVLCHYCNLNEAAIKLAEKSIAINQSIYGSLHNEIAVCYNTLANAYLKLKEVDKAIDYNKKSIEIYKRLYGVSSNELIVPYYNYCSILLLAERYEEALNAIDFSLQIINELYSNGYADIDSYMNLKKEIEDKLNRCTLGN